jgi:hypothetical protein
MAVDDEIRCAILEADHDELTRRLLGYTRKVTDSSPAAQEIVVQAYAEALGGLHSEHYDRTKSVFAFLCAVVQALIAVRGASKVGASYSTH